MIVLDTNVLSALMRPQLNRIVVEWIDRQPIMSIWTTSVSIMESRSGVLLLPSGQRRDGLMDGLDRLLAELLNDRILPFDLDAAEQAARIVATRESRGRNVGTRDTQIAGIVMARGAALATRNVRDFDDLDIRLVDPWEAPAKLPPRRS